MNIECLGFLFAVDAELKFHYPVFFFGGHISNSGEPKKGAGKPPTK